jgi:nascent polypeptide-associated complex subunit alpha
MEQAMKRMGIQQQELDAEQVIIKLKDKEIVLSPVSVAKVNMMGQQTYQISGRESVRQLSSEPEINEDDVQTVMEQAQVDEATARAAIKRHKGDLAEAIMELKS